MFMCVWYVYMCVHVGMFIYTTFIYTVSLQVRLYLKYELDNWGEPEQAPHKREVRAVGLSICLSVRTFMTRKYTRTVLIYGYLQLLIAAFKVGLVHWFVHQRSTNM